MSMGLCQPNASGSSIRRDRSGVGTFSRSTHRKRRWNEAHSRFEICRTDQPRLTSTLQGGGDWHSRLAAPSGNVIADCGGGMRSSALQRLASCELRQCRRTLKAPRRPLALDTKPLSDLAGGNFPSEECTLMYLVFMLFAMFAALGALILSVRWYVSEDQLQRRNARARILPPYKR